MLEEERDENRYRKINLFTRIYIRFILVLIRHLNNILDKKGMSCYFSISEYYGDTVDIEEDEEYKLQ